MNEKQRADLERTIRRHCDAKDHDAAVSAALRGYGPEVFELLLAIHRDEADAAEVYAVFAEGLWHGVRRFEWRSSFRTWAYLIARRTSMRHRRAARVRATRFSPLPEGSKLNDLVQQTRSETISRLRTQRRANLVELRASLPAEDQLLLMLRVDRQLSWNDLARVLRHGEAELDEAAMARFLDGEESELDHEALVREAARLRQRFQSIKSKLHEMGRKAGLIEPK
jgi:RNA polymerase sigma-70 factor (ECF subfamily)